MSNILLGVNIDHIATLRNLRFSNCSPNIIQSALIAEQSGADYITVHLREDRRHIKERDLELLCENKQTKINLEMAITEEMLNIACNIKPNFCCIVPEKRQEITTEHGLNIVDNFEKVKKAVTRLINSGIRVSIFIDAIEKQVEAALQAGASCIEIHTGPYANAKNELEVNKEINIIKKIAKYASNMGLKVHAGHGIDYHNVKDIVNISYISDLNIGYSIISKSIFIGLSQAVKEMKNLINKK